MRHFTIKPLVLAMAVAAVPAVAQAQDGQILEEVIVTGSFRDSLANALNMKRNATGAVDSIVADDIASFPDLNLAESLQRIPGVAITRAAGEGRQISVRGLGPEFTRVRINGMEAVATGGGTDAIGGANRGRGFDFNTFSSELFSSLSVRKTASADVEEGSLGATVDMQAARPFDYDEFTFAASGQLGYNDLSEEVNPKASFLVSNVFADGMFGALLSVSYSERDIQDEGASTVRWNNVNPIGNVNGVPIRIPNPDNADQYIANPDYPADAADGFRPRIPRYDSYNHSLKRLGVGTSFQFRPTDVTEVTLDVLYAKLDATRQEVFMQGILNAGSIDARQWLDDDETELNPNWGRCTGITCQLNLTDYEIDNAGTMSYAQFQDATIRSEHRYDEMTTEFTQYNLSVTHEFTDEFRMSALLGRSESDFDNPIQTTVVAQKAGVDFGYDYRGSRRENPNLTFGPQVSDTAGWATNSVRLRPLGATNTYDAAQFDLEFDLNDAITLKGGINYKNFEFETFEARRSSENAAGVNLAGLMMPYDSGLGSNNPWAIPDLNAINAAYDIYSNTGAFEVSIENRLADNYSAEEESLGVYGQLVFHTQIGDVPVRGDIGLRYVETDQGSTAWARVPDANGDLQDELVTGTHSYSDTLPSLNLVFEPIDDVLIRFSYAEVMARAGLASIRPNVSVSASGGARTVSGGNPTLEPTRAKTYDLSTELYFDNESMLSLALFRKDIESHVQTLRETVPFTDTGLPVSMAIAACEAGPGYVVGECDENVEWNVTTPLNGPGGDLYGFEVAYQQPFTFLPGFWSNFGFIGNFTYVKAQMDYLNADGQVQTTRDLLNLSQDTSSGTLYWEDGTFSARVSMVTRSGYLTNALGRDNNDREGVNATTNVDASFGYQLNDNVKITFEALNLTDEADDQWVDASGNRLSYYHKTGRQYYVGAQYKF